MSQQIFINLPVRDLPKSMAFFKALGYVHNPQFTDDTAACIVISEHIYVMLLTHAKFAQFTSKPIADANQVTQVLLCLSCDSRERVDEMVTSAAANGGAVYDTAKDHGFMYQHSFADPDGHQWELVHMSGMPS